MPKIDVKPYRIDISNPDNMSALVDFLISRGSKLDEKTISENSFILANKFNDIWFQELSLVEVFQREIQYFYKYYEGPRVLPNIDHLLCANSNENDLHIVSYIKDFSDLDQLTNTKQFRKMS